MLSSFQQRSGLPFQLLVYFGVFFAKGFLLPPLFWEEDNKVLSPIMIMPRRPTLLTSAHTIFVRSRESGIVRGRSILATHHANPFPKQTKAHTHTWPNFFGPVSAQEQHLAHQPIIFFGESRCQIAVVVSPTSILCFYDDKDSIAAVANGK